MENSIVPKKIIKIVLKASETCLHDILKWSVSKIQHMVWINMK